MIKLIDNAGNVFAEYKNIYEMLAELNSDPNGSNEWRYYYRPSAGVVNAYFAPNGESFLLDVNGEEADETYDVIED